jgi:hypothetical protein
MVMPPLDLRGTELLQAVELAIALQFLLLPIDRTTFFEHVVT